MSAMSEMIQLARRAEAAVRLWEQRSAGGVGAAVCRAVALGSVMGVCAWCGQAAGQAAPDELRAAFRDPPPAFRPLVILHAGALRRSDVSPWLAARRAGGVVLDAGVQPGSKDVGDEPWNNPTYLDDPGQFARLRGTVQLLREQGYCVWIYDELGYPSGSAGGRVLEGHPEFQVEVLGCRTLRGAGGTSIDITRQHEQVEACAALPVRDGQVVLAEQIDLTHQVAGGATVSWLAPPGDWIVCVFERFQPDTWRRHNIPRRNVNLLDRSAVARFIELTHQRYAAELGPQLAEIQAYFTDEPQFGSAEHWGSGAPECTPMIQWCAQLPAAYQHRTGDDLRTVLPALFHPAGPTTSKIRHAFYDVQSDLAAENFYGQIEAVCHGQGVASSGHMLLEESLLFHVMFSGSMLKNWARMDLPGVDLLGASPYHTMAGWNGDVVPVPEDFSCKMASSVMHLLGKQGTFTESFALADNASLRQVLGVTAWQFAGGITHMSTYSIQQALSAEDYGRFCDFAGRLALWARRGRHVADVAVLVPERSVWATYTPPDGGGFRRYLDRNVEPIAIDRVFRDTCHELLKRQRDFDCLSEELLQQATVHDGQLQLADESFATLVLPEMRMISRAARDKVRALLASGGHVAVIGSLPSQSPECGDDPSVTDEVAGLLAAFPDQARHFAHGAPVSEMVMWIDARVPRIVCWEGPADVRLLHRRERGREIILLANPGPQAAAGTLTAPSAGNASLWDPETGEVQELGPVGAGTALPLTLPAASARLVVVDMIW